VGAVVAGPRAAHIFAVGNHGSTFGGNPLAMRAGVETIRIMERDGLLENAAAMGHHFTEALQRELAGQLASGAVKDIRGRGLMIGIELAIPCSALMQQCLDKGLLISVTADSVVRLVPPLIVTATEVDAMVAILAPLIRNFLATKGAPA
jgi:acetylornithine aminotransferase